MTRTQQFAKLNWKQMLGDRVEKLHPVTGAVRRMYEAYPYPHYPLFIPLRWQDGILGSSLLAHRLLFSDATHKPWPLKNVLVAGSGEVLPYILRHLEPSHHRLHCVDLSKSSLRRARLRLLGNLKPLKLIHGDLDKYLDETSLRYDHIDCYGVLHCMLSPGVALKKMAAVLQPAGTIRLMVYNRESRRWLFHLQKALRVLGLFSCTAKDLNLCRKLLETLKEASPAIESRLSQMGEATLLVDARLVDTFLHTREMQISWGKWLKYFADAGLRPLGIFDRYGELDDLCNPLLDLPNQHCLESRSKDGRFENNLEVFLSLSGAKITCSPASTSGSQFWLRAHYLWLQSRLPPKHWFDFNETRLVRKYDRWCFWSKLVSHTTGIGDGSVDALVAKYHPDTLSRLARLGAVLPGQLRKPSLIETAMRPLYSHMEVPPRPATTALGSNPRLRDQIVHILHLKGLSADDRRLKVIFERLERAQIGA